MCGFNCYKIKLLVWADFSMIGTIGGVPKTDPSNIEAVAVLSGSGYYNICIK